MCCIFYHNFFFSAENRIAPKCIITAEELPMKIPLDGNETQNEKERRKGNKEDDVMVIIRAVLYLLVFTVSLPNMYSNVKPFILSMFQ